MQKNSTYSEELGPSSWVESSFSPQLFLCVCACTLWATEDGGAGRRWRWAEGQERASKGSVLGDVAPVTGPRRAVMHCDRACTPNAPTPPTSPPLSRLLLAVGNNGSCPLVVATVCRQRLPSAPVTCPSQRTLHQLTPENLLPYINLHRERSFAPCSQHRQPN